MRGILAADKMLTGTLTHDITVVDEETNQPIPKYVTHCVVLARESVGSEMGGRTFRDEEEEDP